MFARAFPGLGLRRHGADLAIPDKKAVHGLEYLAFLWIRVY